MKTIIAILLAMLSTITHADSWTGADKNKHIAIGAMIGFSTTMITGDPTHGLIAGASIGIAKEFYDMNQSKHTASYKDAIVTIGGAMFGAYVGNLIITPTSISYKTGW